MLLQTTAPLRRRTELAFPAIYGLTAVAGARWIGVDHATMVGVVVGFIGWLTTHFDVAFDDQKTREEKETVRRVGAAVVTAPSRMRRALRGRRAERVETR